MKDGQNKNLMKKTGIFVLLIMITGGIYFALKNPFKKSTPLISSSKEKTENQATLETRDFVYTMRNKGKKEWELKSKFAKQYEENKRIELEPVELIAYDKEEKPTLILKADKGEIDLNTEDVMVAENIVITFSEKIKFTTEKLKWMAKEKKLITDEKIKLIKDNIIITGKGLEADREMERINIKEKVRIEIKESKK